MSNADSIKVLRDALDKANDEHDAAMAAWADARRDDPTNRALIASLRGKALAAARKHKAAGKAFVAVIEASRG